MVKKWILSSMTIVVAAFLGLSVCHRSDFHSENVDLADDFETKLREKEAALPLRPDTDAKIVWMHPTHERTDVALVQLHGFSASRREISPVGETIARAFGWNLFMNRFCGHGLGSQGMGALTAQCLVDDAEFAFAVGKKIGEKVVLLATSTAVPLALSLIRGHPESIAAIIVVSPNFRPAPIESLLLKGPLGGWLASHLVPDHKWTPTSAAEAEVWTTSYPAIALHEMMDLLSWAEGFNLGAMKVPLLAFYSESDEVVSVPLMKARLRDYGNLAGFIEVKSGHVLAGEIKSPATTDFVIQRAEEFLRAQGLSSSAQNH